MSAYEVYIDGRHMLPDYDRLEDAIRRATVMSNRAPSSSVEIRGALDGETYKRFKAGQSLIVEDAPEVEPAEDAADVLTDAINADPATITADTINELYDRLDAAINGRPKAPVLQLVRGGRDEYGEGNGGSYPRRDR